MTTNEPTARSGLYEAQRWEQRDLETYRFPLFNRVPTSTPIHCFTSPTLYSSARDDMSYVPTLRAKFRAGRYGDPANTVLGRSPRSETSLPP